MRRALVLVVTGAFLVALAAPASATPDEIATEISYEVMSPFCPGVTLHDCPSDSARRLRLRIAGWAGDGMTKEQIFDRLIAEYGEEVRATPRAEGSGLGAWLLPALAIGAGGVLLVLLLRRMTSSPEDPSPEPEEELTGEDRARLDAELGAYRTEGIT